MKLGCLTTVLITVLHIYKGMNKQIPLSYLYLCWRVTKMNQIYLQLAIRSEHVCRSIGQSFRFIGQARVRDILSFNGMEDILGQMIRILQRVLKIYQSIISLNEFKISYLMLYKTSPSGKTLTYALLTSIAWKWPTFSLRKNVSGIQTFFGSVSVK